MTVIKNHIFIDKTMKHIILSIILGLVAIINASAQNTMQTALDIGIKASSFSYSDTKDRKSVV